VYLAPSREEGAFLSLRTISKKKNPSFTNIQTSDNNFCRVNKTQQEVGKEFSVQEFSFEKLDSLITIANAGSMTVAAKKKHRQIGSISRHIKELEKFFGCSLRQKTGKTVSLSPEGDELVSLIRRQMEELKNFRDKHTKNLNSVNLAAGDSLLHLVLFPKLAEIQNKYKETTISVSALSTFEIIQGLQNFTIDLGLLRQDSLISKGQDGNAKTEPLSSEELGEYKYAIFVPKNLLGNSEVNEAEILKLRFAMIKDHWDIDFLSLAKKSGNNFSNMRVLCENFTQVFRLVRLGLYAGILPVFCKQLLPRDLIIYFEPVFLNNRKHKIVLAWNPALAETKTLLSPFINDLAEELRISFFELSIGT
jgi:DNA-binding transcriptional LysR family regulator